MSENYPPVSNQPTYQPAQKDSTLAILSLVFGIASYLVVPVIGSLAAIILGHIAKSEIKKSNGTLTGNGMATAGLVLGYVQWAFLILGLIILVLVLGFAARNGTTWY
jgi:hypothetical protein